MTHVVATLESPTQPPSTSQQEEVSCAGMGGGGGVNGGLSGSGSTWPADGSAAGPAGAAACAGELLHA